MFHRITDHPMVQKGAYRKTCSRAKMNPILNLTMIWCKGVAETRHKPFGTRSG
jgi:hypothetical protein